jgi:hypothetical protein
MYDIPMTLHEFYHLCQDLSEPGVKYPIHKHLQTKSGTLHSKAKVVDSLSVTPWVWLDLGRIRPLEPSV